MSAKVKINPRLLTKSSPLKMLFLTAPQSVLLLVLLVHHLLTKSIHLTPSIFPFNTNFTAILLILLILHVSKIEDIRIHVQLVSWKRFLQCTLLKIDPYSIWWEFFATCIKYTVLCFYLLGFFYREMFFCKKLRQSLCLNIDYIDHCSAIKHLSTVFFEINQPFLVSV